jgi:mono/diheme cytochrome c family protein
MRRVVTGLFGVLAVALVSSAIVGAQTPASAGPAAVPPEARKTKSAVPSSAASIEAGSQLYQKYCRFCHGNTGQGDSKTAPKSMTPPPSLADTTWVRGSSEGEIFWIIQNGAPPKYEMKGLKGKISDNDTWNLVNYVRSLGGVPKAH